MVATLLPHTSINIDAFVELEARQFFSITLFSKFPLKALFDALKTVDFFTFYIS